jgi:hypothetical protein
LRVQRVPARVDARAAVDHEDESVLLDLMVAQGLARLEHDQHRAGSLVRIEHDG